MSTVVIVALFVALPILAGCAVYAVLIKHRGPERGVDRTSPAADPAWMLLHQSMSQDSGVTADSHANDAAAAAHTSHHHHHHPPSDHGHTPIDTGSHGCDSSSAASADAGSSGGGSSD
jgi:hypothetical protein